MLLLCGSATLIRGAYREWRTTVVTSIIFNIPFFPLVIAIHLLYNPLEYLCEMQVYRYDWYELQCDSNKWKKLIRTRQPTAIILIILIIRT